VGPFFAPAKDAHAVVTKLNTEITR